MPVAGPPPRGPAAAAPRAPPPPRGPSPISLVFTKISARDGSNATPPQLPPPTLLGNDGPVGEYATRSFPPIAAVQYAVASGEILLTSLSFMVLRASGGGLMGNGCVGHSLGFAVGTGTSSTP